MILERPLTPAQAAVAQQAFASPYRAVVMAGDGIDATFLTVVQFVFCLNCPDGRDHPDLVIAEGLLAELDAVRPLPDPLEEQIAAVLRGKDEVGRGGCV
jgi:hypothetical protein